MTHAPIYDPEPTPEFNQSCLDVINRWQGGELPYEAAAEELSALGQQAVDDNHLTHQGRVEQLFGFMQGYRGNLNVSIHHFERARAFYMQVGNKKRIATCDLNIGETYRYKGDFNRARALFDKAYLSAHEIGDVSNESLALGNRGQMLLSMGNLDAAQADLQASGQLVRQLPFNSEERTTLLCELYHGMVQIYLNKEYLPEAWEEAMKGYRIAQAVSRPLERGFSNRAIAEVITAMGTAPDPDFADDPDVYYQAANDAFREINIEGEMARTMFVQAKSLAKRGRRMTAARKLQLAMVIFTRLGMVDDAAKAAEAQLDIL